jgi:hypothetical protein
LTLSCIGPLRPENTVEAQVLRWDIDATIVEIADPQMTFPDVRVGDPVRGFLSYDLSTQGDDTDPNDVFYEHDPTFQVVGMVIENPRDGTEIGFVPDNTFLPAIVEVINDGEDEMTGPFDDIIALQTVLPPGGTGEFLFAIVGVDLFGPPDVLSDASLPTALNLDDWPEASIVYLDVLTETFIFAEVRTLTPVVPEPSTVALLLVGALGNHLARTRRRNWSLRCDRDGAVQKGTSVTPVRPAGPPGRR